MTIDDDLYEVLGVSEKAPAEVIKAAVKAQQRLWHPDQNEDPSAHTRISLINLAAEVLLDPERRRAYDRERSASAATPTSKGPAVPVPTPALIDFGELRPGDRRVQSISVRSGGSHPSSISVDPQSSSDGWQVSDAFQPADGSDVVLRIELSMLAPKGSPGPRESAIEVRFDDRTVSIPIRVVIAAAPAAARTPTFTPTSSGTSGTSTASRPPRSAAAAAGAARMPRDVVVMLIAAGLCVTVLVPWLIGRHLLRGTLLHPTDPGVWDTTARGDGPYFLADWFAGCATILLLAAAIVLIGRWSGRVPTIVAAIGLAVLTLIFVVPPAISTWSSAELGTITALRVTETPVHSGGCLGSASSFVDYPDGTSSLWQAYPITEIAKTSDPDQTACSEIEVFEGWRYVTTVTLPEGQTIGTGSLTGLNEVLIGFDGLRDPDAAFVWAFTDSGELDGFGIADPEAVWRLTGASIDEGDVWSHTRDPIAGISGGALVYIPRGLDSWGSYLEVYQGSTGALIGTLNPCVAGGYIGEVYSYGSNPITTLPAPSIVASCRYEENGTLTPLWVVDGGGIYDEYGAQVG